MQKLTNGAERLRKVVSPPPDVSLTPPEISAEHKAPRDPSAAVLPPGTRDPLTAEQERAMVEHLPIVQFIARRIHERLPRTTVAFTPTVVKGSK